MSHAATPLLATILQVTKRRSWRNGLLLAACLLILSSLIQLGHDHQRHKSNNAHECVICQHSTTSDKTLLSTFVYFTLAVTALTIFTNTPNQTRLGVTHHIHIRAPPTPAHTH